MREKVFLLLVLLVVNPYSVSTQGTDEDIESSFEGNKSICGNYWPPEPPDFEIQNGTVGDFPWHVGMVVFKEPWGGNALQGRWLCGGSVLNEIWILTVALCLENATKAEVYPGAIHLFNNSIFEIHYAYEFHVHPNYTILNRVANIGLIKMHKPLVMDDPAVKPLKISNHEIETFTAIKTPGWGAQYDRDYYAYSNKSLMYAASMTVSEDYCQRYYSVNILKTEFCAVVDEGDPQEDRGCFGTIGAAAIHCYNKTAVGIFAFIGGNDRSPCGHNYPMGYVRLYDYIAWISETTNIPI